MSDEQPLSRTDEAYSTDSVIRFSEPQAHLESTKYRTVSESSPELLDKNVNKLLDNGWQVHGPLNTSNTSDGKPIYTQAMISIWWKSYNKDKEFLNERSANRSQGTR